MIFSVKLEPNCGKTVTTEPHTTVPNDAINQSDRASLGQEFVLMPTGGKFIKVRVIQTIQRLVLGMTVVGLNSGIFLL